MIKPMHRANAGERETTGRGLPMILLRDFSMRGSDMFNKVDYAMVMVSDMERSIRFYRDALGFRVRFQSEFWTEFESGGTTLALHGGAVAATGSHGQGREIPAGTVHLGFSVANISDAVGTLRSRGVRFVMEPTLQEQEGITLAVFLDPDGTPITIAEPIKK